MIQRFLVPIQGFSDIITNSSSEIFLINGNNFDKSLEEIKESIEKRAKKQSRVYLRNLEKLEDEFGLKKAKHMIPDSEVEENSGMGGEFSMYRVSKIEQKMYLYEAGYWNKAFENLSEEEIDKLIEENDYIFCDVDWNRQYTINILINEFGAIRIG